MCSHSQPAKAVEGSEWKGISLDMYKLKDAIQPEQNGMKNSSSFHRVLFDRYPLDILLLFFGFSRTCERRIYKREVNSLIKCTIRNESNNKTHNKNNNNNGKCFNYIIFSICGDVFFFISSSWMYADVSRSYVCCLFKDVDLHSICFSFRLGIFIISQSPFKCKRWKIITNFLEG